MEFWLLLPSKFCPTENVREGKNSLISKNWLRPVNQPLALIWFSSSPSSTLKYTFNKKEFELKPAFWSLVLSETKPRLKKLMYKIFKCLASHVRDKDSCDLLIYFITQRQKTYWNFTCAMKQNTRYLHQWAEIQTTLAYHWGSAVSLPVIVQEASLDVTESVPVPIFLVVI